jgi:hypothetical protein
VCLVKLYPVRVAMNFGRDLPGSPGIECSSSSLRCLSSVDSSCDQKQCWASTPICLNRQCGGRILRRSRDGGLRRCRRRSTCRSLTVQSTCLSPRRCIGRCRIWKRMRLRWSREGHNVVLSAQCRPFRSRPSLAAPLGIDP